MENANPVQQESVLTTSERSMIPEVLDEKWPKPNTWLGIEIAATLCVGLALGKMIFGGFGSGPATLDLSQGEWVRSTSGSFNIFLPKGWENFTAEANVGVAEDSKRDIVFRQKSAAGTRLFVIQKANADKPGEGKTEALLGAWMAGERRELLRLKQEMGEPAAGTAGVPALMFHIIRPASGSNLVSGSVVINGGFYNFSYASPYSKDDELLLGLLGSMSEAKAAMHPGAKAVKPAPAKPAPARHAVSPAAKPAKKKK